MSTLFKATTEGYSQLGEFVKEKYIVANSYAEVEAEHPNANKIEVIQSKIEVIP